MFNPRVHPEILLFIALGFCAEMIDGTAGMAYGVSSNTFLRTAGVPSAVSSACVHASEIFTTLASGISHWRMGNVDKRLFKMLLIAGVPGGVLGAWVLTSFESAALVVPLDSFAQYWNIVLGLIIGGVIAAPLAARLTKVIPVRGMLLFVGGLVIILNVYKLAGALGVA